MAKMTAAEAAVRVLESEGVDLVFGQPGAAILPLYQAMKERGTIQHMLIRHEERGTHAASDCKNALQDFVEAAREYKSKGLLPDRTDWVREIRGRKERMHRKTNFDNIPIKPQRVFQEINSAFDKMDSGFRRVSKIGTLRRSATTEWTTFGWSKRSAELRCE
jgi:glyoxylate carboligase